MREKTAMVCYPTLPLSTVVDRMRGDGTHSPSPIVRVEEPLKGRALLREQLGLDSIGTKKGQK